MSETLTHWKKLKGNSNYLGAWSLEPGKDMVLTIAEARREPVKDEKGEEADCLVLHFKEKVLPMIVNSTNCKSIEKIYRTPYVEEWRNRAIQLYTKKVKAFGDTVDALRIREFVPKVNKITLTCADCGKPIQAYQKMSAEQVAMYMQKTFGKSLCYECGVKANEAVKEAQKKDADAITDALKEEVEDN